jgi:hypothetical protein
MSRELRIQIDDDAYEQLRGLADSDHVDAEKYAQRLLLADLARQRFETGARAFIEEHGDAFVTRFGTRSAAHDGHAAA